VRKKEYMHLKQKEQKCNKVTEKKQCEGGSVCGINCGAELPYCLPKTEHQTYLFRQEYP
jgi:hypothetical protein